MEVSLALLPPILVRYQLVVIVTKRTKKDNEPSIVINREIEFYAAIEIRNDEGTREI